MNTVQCRLTVYFEGPFWVGVFEREDGKKLESAKVVFGAEPKDYEVYDHLLNNWGNLRFSPPVETVGYDERKHNPKRMMREAEKMLSAKGIGTKSQQALNLQHEQTVTERKVNSRQKSEEEKLRKLELRQQKHKEKHKGHMR